MNFYIFLTLMALIIIGTIIYFIVRRKRNSPKNVTQIFDNGNDKFTIIGKQDNFNITKNGEIEFLVKNGKIIACRDLRVSKEFLVYINGEMQDEHIGLDK